MWDNDELSKFSGTLLSYFQVLQELQSYQYRNAAAELGKKMQEERGLDAAMAHIKR